MADRSTHSVPPRIALRDFFRNPEQTAFKISPDGRNISFMAPYERRQNIFVRPFGSDEIRQLTFEKDRDIAGYFWKGNSRLLFMRDTAGDENFRLYAVDPDGRNLDCLTPFAGVRAQIIDELEENEHEILVSLNKRNAEVFDVYRMNIHTGEMMLVAENPGNISSWVTDHEGRIRMAQQTDGVNNTLLYRESEQETFRPVITTNFRESLDPIFFSFDNRQLYASSNLGRDRSAIVRIDPATAQEIELIFEHPEVDVASLSYSKKRKVITAATYYTAKRERTFFDYEISEIFDELEEKLPDYEINIVSHDREEEKFIVRTWSDRSLGAYYFYDKNSSELSKLADVGPWLHEEDMAEMKPVSYTSRDGLTVHGYLTLPKGRAAEGLPVVIHPHGGPWVRDHWGFNPLVQFLANRGYAVFQMNYRGSTGYGKKFWEISFRQWGRAMQDDISDGVRWLTEQGIADPSRVAIYGGSYGGYATLAGLAFTPELYSCGVDYVGVSNLFTFLTTIPPYWKPFLEMMYEMVGHPERDKELLRAASPVFHVDKIRAPLFVAQGAKDPRVNINESDQIVEALRSRGVEVPYMVKENEGHGFQNEENRFEFYEAMEEFLARHLRPEMSAEAAAVTKHLTDN